MKAKSLPISFCCRPLLWPEFGFLIPCFTNLVIFPPVSLGVFLLGCTKSLHKAQQIFAHQSTEVVFRPLCFPPLTVEQIQNINDMLFNFIVILVPKFTSVCASRAVWDSMEWTLCFSEVHQLCLFLTPPNPFSSQT